MVRNGWNSVERRWNKLGEVQTEVFGAICRSGVPQKFDPGAPKMSQNAKQMQFQDSSGPKQLEQYGTKVE